MLLIQQALAVMRRFGPAAVALVLVLLPVGCIGTDFIDEIVGPLQEARLEVDPPAAALLVGETAQFTATYYDTDGEPVAAAITWASSDAAA